MRLQIPTQDFFNKDIGLPLTMNPNFEDLSCEMIFGQVRGLDGVANYWVTATHRVQAPVSAAVIGQLLFPANSSVSASHAFETIVVRLNSCLGELQHSCTCNLLTCTLAACGRLPHRLPAVIRRVHRAVAPIFHPCRVRPLLRRTQPTIYPVLLPSAP